jgi:hypothetical protein
MNQWTEAAKRELENYFTRVRPALQTSGADPDEVVEDLRRHLAAEVQAAKLAIVTDEDVRRLLARIGAPPPPASEPVKADATTEPLKPAEPRAGAWVFIMAVLIPAATFVIELVTGICAGAFFDPMPTLLHVVLVALVPALNLAVWSAIYSKQSRRKRLLSWANGLAIGVAIFYSLLFVPMMIPGLIGIIFCGFGLLPLSPALSLIGALLLRSKLRRLGDNAPASLPGFWRGISIAWLLLLTVELPTLVTRIGMQKAISADPEQQLTGIRWLRTWGREETLLRACYGYTARAQSSDLISWLIAGPDRANPEQARAIYFRVTGRPFNSEPAPQVRTGRGTWDGLDDWTWDEDQGGEAVGGRIKGLFLSASRLDSTINPDAAWSYTEWTMEFRNDSRQQREARAQILLPPGGVVSRLTLWVNGEEREAAFAGRAQTRGAYQKVAIQQRRDPVLVTTCGPDRVLMQCFPVPPDGGVMKIRLGITAPLHLNSETNGLVRLPVALERNFTVNKSFEHAVWAQAAGDIASDCTALAREVSNHGQWALRGGLSETELVSSRSLLRIPRAPARRCAWTKDTRNPNEQFIRQEISNALTRPATNVIFVLDGSASMARYWADITQAIMSLPATIPNTILIASDHVETITNTTALMRFHPAGGQDNLPALLESWNLALRKPGSVIVWIHGPQPLKLAPEAALLQAVERSPVRPEIYEVQTDFGPDRLMEYLEALRLRSVLRTGALKPDLERLVACLRGGAETWQIQRRVVPDQITAQANDALEGTLHLARLWAADAVQKLKSKNKVEEAIKQAALFQLVTPVSGAVVLETKEQFAQNGLQPVDVDTVPSVPEPSAGALIVVGLLVLRLARKRRLTDQSA